MASQIDKLRAEISRLQVEISEVRLERDRAKRNLEGCLDELKGSLGLIENWATGPAFRKAGVFWPNGQCNAIAYLKARKWLKRYYEAND